MKPTNTSGKRFEDTQPATEAFAVGLGLEAREFSHVCETLGRTPTVAETGIFSAMYSEHCSYKSSRKFFKRFPTTGKRVVQGPGENAGILDIGGEWAVAFKMESHNHPSFIEPYQGAATGVGGILRDIFTMGARPIASMDALFFGIPDEAKMLSVCRGVVRGVGDYGNCVGVPTVAGQTVFHRSYQKNPLVNAFTLGLVKKEDVLKGLAAGEGNWLVYVGAKTGRDGVRGAAMASQQFSSTEELDRPAVQVGDPFTEKLLLEATLEAMQARLMVGIQDMGAAGLTSSSFEMAERGQVGLRIDLDAVPKREINLSAFEILLSESQERMLICIEPGKWEALKRIYEKWELDVAHIGEVVTGDRVQIDYEGNRVVDLPISLVTTAPPRNLPFEEPADLTARWKYDEAKFRSLSLDSKWDALTESLQFGSAEPVIRQYDRSVGNRTEMAAQEDAAVLKLREIEGRDVRLALSADCNPRVCSLWPEEGGRRAVAECALNLAIKGAEPIGVTDCLNFGSPKNPGVLWQFERSIEGIAQSCEALNIPVVSGNVSFYNETDFSPIYPTPMIGMVGVMEGDRRVPKSGFGKANLDIVLLGHADAEIGGSFALATVLGEDRGRPSATDLSELVRVVKLVQDLAAIPDSISMHDISDGGLLLALLEMSFHARTNTVGFSIEVPAGVDSDRFLFGETVSRVLLACDSTLTSLVKQKAEAAGVSFHPLGRTVSEASAVVKVDGKEFKKAIAPLRERWLSRWKPIFGEN